MINSIEEFFTKHKASLPSYVLRHFEKEEHLDTFINGSGLRLALYSVFTDSRIDYKRLNPNEGKMSCLLEYSSSQVSSAEIHITAPIYIISCFHPDVDINHRKELGKYAVKINNPLLFHKRIREHLEAELKPSWLGHIVYGRAKFKEETINKDIATLAICSDIENNNKNKEIRFAYYISVDALLAKGKNQLKFFTSEENAIKLPNYVYLKNIKINDLCEKIII